MVRLIREVDLSSGERMLLVDCLSVIETDGSFLPIKSPITRLRSVKIEERLPFSSGGAAIFVRREVEVLSELSAGCLAAVGAKELRVPIVSPIRERWLVVSSFFTFERDGVLREESLGLRLLESPILEAPPERAAG